MQTIHNIVTTAARLYGLTHAEASQYVDDFRALGERIGAPVSGYTFTDDDAELILSFIEKCADPVSADDILDEAMLAGQAVRDARAKLSRAEEERDEIIRRARRLGYTMNEIAAATPGVSISRVQQILSR